MTVLKVFLILPIQLKPGEVEFLAKNTSAALSEFERISETVGKERGDVILNDLYLH